MAPFFALAGGFAIFRLLGLAGIDMLDDWQTPLRWALALMFVLTGTTHFLPGWRREMAAMVPPGLPRPELLVALTGVLELAGAVGLLIPRVAPLAAVLLALLMLAMFPANVVAARHHLQLGGRQATPLFLRAALQVVFVGAAIAAAF
ncbi:DoxX family protein [Actinoplanes rectilineatus]|uniref:DoxX family protein n=1 Tax=Actinoplanes rectilineatus TaxID=113571 RepID=UPI0005F2C867|nr:DoxX family membrane protein [Actinoplanes rectilineatus]